MYFSLLKINYNQIKQQKMKKLVLVVAAVFAIGLTSCKEAKKETSQEVYKVENLADTTVQAHSYKCPMNCENEKTYDKAGSCPVCKMDLKVVEGAKKACKKDCKKACCAAKKSCDKKDCDKKECKSKKECKKECADKKDCKSKKDCKKACDKKDCDKKECKSKKDCKKEHKAKKACKRRL